MALISNQRHHLDRFNRRQKSRRSRRSGKYFGFIIYSFTSSHLGGTIQAILVVCSLFTCFLKYTTRVCFRSVSFVMPRLCIPISQTESPHVRKSRFWNSGNFCLWNPESWALESGTQLKVSEIPLTIRIQNPSSPDNDWNSVPEIRNPRRGIQNPRLLSKWRATERS